MSAFSFFFPGTTRFAKLSRRALAGLASCLFLCLPCGAGGDPPCCPDGSPEDLIVPHGCLHVIAGDTKSYETVTVKSGGTLSLEDAGVLEVRDTLTIHPNGTFQFNADDGETTPILRATLTLEIDGHLQMTDPADDDGGAGATIAAQTPSTDIVHLKNAGKFSADVGWLTITAKLENDGIIDANGGNVTFSGELQTGSAGMFLLSGDHTMKFEDGSEVSGDLGAHFDVQDGTMRFAGSHSTTGGFRQTGGKVQADAGETFSASGAFDAGAGTSP